MPAKVRLPGSECPILKWDKHVDPDAEAKLIPTKQVD